ncbi:hypothetical protein [Pedobacter glucosidilyticus]|uniref:hypothetical protein n=1 Tax=Pedobacter glucosidilyticus TaxID=1122941 RepID=UPI0026E96335|nr:hypothetical protein [Pedobacter glucosidilyticus]
MKKYLKYSLLALLLFKTNETSRGFDLANCFFIEYASNRYIKLPSVKNYIVYNEKGEKLNAYIFFNYQTIDGKNTSELFIYFDIKPSFFVLVIALPPKLIGIPELYKTMKIDSLGNLNINRKSLMFTPINIGIEKMIDKYFISEKYIYFDTFGNLKKVGNKVYIKKVN